MRSKMLKLVVTAAVFGGALSGGVAPAHALCTDETLDMHAQDQATWDRGSDAVVCLINEKRRSRGLPALTSDPALELAAQRHAVDQMNRRYSGHFAMEPAPNGVSFEDRAKNAGYPSDGFVQENEAAHLRTPFDAANAWTTDQGHCANMVLGHITDIGVGYAYDPAWDAEGVVDLLVGRKTPSGSRVYDYQYAGPCPDPGQYGRQEGAGTLTSSDTFPTLENDPFVTEDARPGAPAPSSTLTPVAIPTPTPKTRARAGLALRGVRPLAAKRHRGRGMRFTISCERRCTGTVRLKVGRKTVAKRRFAIKAGKAKAVTVRVRKRVDRKLRRRGRRKVTFVVVSRSEKISGRGSLL